MISCSSDSFLVLGRLERYGWFSSDFCQVMSTVLTRLFLAEWGWGYDWRDTFSFFLHCSRGELDSLP